MLRARISRLERLIKVEDPLPYVVELQCGETQRQAIDRVLNGRAPPRNWRCIIAPPPMTVEEWAAQYAPSQRDPIKNPT